MSGQELTVEAVERELKRLSTEYPDTRYEMGETGFCSYLKGSAGPGQGCIFGQALVACGVPVEKLQEADSRDDNTGVSINVLWEELTGTPARHWWGELQEDQDFGETWGQLGEAYLAQD